ncbi:MAG: tol-pal system protein YbgF [Aestuariivirgaceae bacterium]
MTKLIHMLAAAGMFGTAAVSLPDVAHAQSDNWNALYDRIIRLEHEVRAVSGSRGASAPQGDVAYRLSAIEEQLRKLIGNVNAARGQMRDMQARIKRLEERRSGRAATQQLTQVEPASMPDSLPVDDLTTQSSDLDLTVLPETGDSGTLTGGVIDGTRTRSQFEPAQPPQVLGQLIIRNNDGSLPGSDPGESSLLPGQVESAALDNPTGSGGATPDDLYERSYKNLLGRRFGLAEAGFKTFVNQNGKHPLASKAQYWLGETCYVQGRYKQAAQSFLTGYRTYPKGGRAAESLLKLGMSLNKLGQKKQACGAYAEVGRSYPSSKAAGKQAARESKRAGC